MITVEGTIEYTGEYHDECVCVGGGGGGVSLVQWGCSAHCRIP